MFKKKVHILGTLFTVEVMTVDKDDTLLEKSGYCDPYAKRIVIRDFKAEIDDKPRAEAIMRETLIHELTHCHFYESGLWSSSSPSENWSMDEQLVDWISIQLPKIVESIRECGVTI